MRRFWKQRNELDQLERELRHARPRPRPDFLETLATQMRGERPTGSHRPALRFRLAAAAVLTGTLGVAGAASGGLAYANAASSHTLKAVAHVFTSSNTSGSRGQAANRDAAAPSVDTSVSAAAESVVQRSSKQANAAQHQYVEFVFVCLRVPPKHPSTFITLRVPRVAADALIARGLATPGPC
jgi:hypothetical protein